MGVAWEGHGDSEGVRIQRSALRMIYTMLFDISQSILGVRNIYMYC